MKIIIICAISKNRVLGKDNKLLWHIPEDLKHFKDLTYGYPIIMGRKTFESLPGILPNRRHIVITKKSNFEKHKPIEIFNSIDMALKMLKEQKEEKVFIIGGGEIFNYSLKNNLVDEIELSIINKEFEGDTFFPELDSLWKVIREEEYQSKDFIIKNITYKK